MQTTQKRQKGYKGLAMEGSVARWYAKIRRSGSQIQEWRKQAAHLTGGLPDGADVLEVAPGLGYFAIAMARSRFGVSTAPPSPNTESFAIATASSSSR